MKTETLLPHARGISRLLLGGVLLVAAIAKLTHIAQFIAAFTVLPQFSAAGWQPVLMLIPAVELVVGLRLVFDWRDDIAAGAALALFTVFLLYQLAVALRTGFFVKPASLCPCFTFGSTESSPQIHYVLRGVLLAGLAAFAVVGTATLPGLRRGRSAGPP